MSSDLTSQAVSAALNNNWHEAIKLNLTLLKEDPKNVEALNRLARAYKEAGNLQLALKTYRKVLTFDRFNPIAQKNLKLLESLPRSFKKQENSFHSNHCSLQMFLEEPGKTKVVNLVNLAPTSILLHLCCGNQTNLLIRRHSVAVTDGNGAYLGALPDDLSTKLIKRISAGNRYETFIKTVSKNCLAVFVREIYRSAKFKNQPTFPGAGGENYSPGKSETSLSEEEVANEEFLKTGPQAEPLSDEELPAG